jgi:hypothetical protein
MHLTSNCRQHTVQREWRSQRRTRRAATGKAHVRTGEQGGGGRSPRTSHLVLRRLRWRETQEGEGPGESEGDGEDERLGDQTTENQQSSACPGAAALDLIAGNTGTGTGNGRRERRRRHEGGSGLGDGRMDLVGGHFNGALQWGRNRHLNATGEALEALGGWAVGTSVEMRHL